MNTNHSHLYVARIDGRTVTATGADGARGTSVYAAESTLGMIYPGRKIEAIRSMTVAEAHEYVESGALPTP